MKKSPRIEIVCIGSELLNGRVNTHASYLGERLATIGLSVAREQTVGDDPKLMEEVFREALKRADVIFSCGGLGPTFDDITRDVWSKVLKKPLRRRLDLVEEIREKFRGRGLVMPDKNKRQGDVLGGATIIQNSNGTAPGQYLRSKNKTIVLLPGPARELVPMVQDFVLSRLQAQYSSLYIRQKCFLSVGVPESKIDEMIRPLVSRYARLKGCAVTHGILASQSIITVKYSVEGTNPVQVDEATDFLAKKFKAKLGPLIFGEDSDTLPGVIGDLLRSQGKSIATAESCTGGFIAKLLTDQAGASDYFVEAAVTYTNASKEKRLGVSSRILEKRGAVSEQVAKEMAIGFRKKTGSDYVLSVTGIAGPSGGSDEKPIGLVYVGCAGPQRTTVKKFQFTGDREWIRHRSALMALDLLRKELLA